jgi:hypothetical protein
MESLRKCPNKDILELLSAHDPETTTKHSVFMAPTNLDVVVYSFIVFVLRRRNQESNSSRSVLWFLDNHRYTCPPNANSEREIEYSYVARKPRSNYKENRCIIVLFLGENALVLWKNDALVLWENDALVLWESLALLYLS